MTATTTATATTFTQQDGKPSPLSDDKLVIYLGNRPRPEWIARVQSRYIGLEVRWDVNLDDKGKWLSPDDAPRELWDGVTLLATLFPPRPELIPNLRYVQLGLAGPDAWLSTPAWKDPNIPFCNISGTQATQISEWVIGTWLENQHQSHSYLDYKKKGQWGKAHPVTSDSAGQRMGILGYGSIGRQCARVARALGMEVYSFTRSEKATPESKRDTAFSVVPGTGDPDGIYPTRWFHGSSQEDIHGFIGQDLDILVLALPLTSSNRRMIGPKQFRNMSKRKTFLSNFSRGPIVDTDALVEALEQALIRGAAVDVTDPEPLPHDHPLWKVPNVFISPHISWSTTQYWDRVLSILEMNLERLARGEPLINQLAKTSFK